MVFEQDVKNLNEAKKAVKYIKMFNSLTNGPITEIEVEPCKNSKPSCARYVIGSKQLSECIDDDNVCYKLEMNATLHFFDDVPGKISLMTQQVYFWWRA